MFLNMPTAFLAIPRFGFHQFDVRNASSKPQKMCGEKNFPTMFEVLT